MGRAVTITIRPRWAGRGEGAAEVVVDEGRLCGLYPSTTRQPVSARRRHQIRDGPSSKKDCTPEAQRSPLSFLWILIQACSPPPRIREASALQRGPRWLWSEGRTWRRPREGRELHEEREPREGRGAPRGGAGALRGGRGGGSTRGGAHEGRGGAHEGRGKGGCGGGPIRGVGGTGALEGGRVGAGGVAVRREGRRRG